MYRGHTVGVIVPAYNEEEHIATVLETIPEYVDRIFVVDDCSTDRTWDIIRSVADVTPTERDRPTTDVPHEVPAITSKQIVPPSRRSLTDGGTFNSSRIVPIRHPTNRGAGGAIRTGYLRALEEPIDIVVTMDADGQMDPDQMTNLLDPIVEGVADYSKGNRLLNKEFRIGMSRWRFFGNSILTFLTKIASGYWKIMDPQNGYTAISRTALETVDIGEMYEYYGYCNDLLVKLNARGMRVADVAMPAVYGDERSSIKYTAYIPKVSWMLLNNFLWRLKVKYLVRDFHPLVFFYGVGIATIVGGLLSGAWSVYATWLFADPLFVRISLSLLFVTMGCLFLIFAMLFDMQVNQDKEVQIYA